MPRQRQAAPPRTARGPNDPLSDFEKALATRIYDDTSVVTSRWKAWIVAWLEENPPRLPYGSLSGAPSAFIGSEIDFSQVTSTVTISATTEGTADTIVTGSALEFDGFFAISVHFFAPAQATNGTIHIVLYEDGVSIGEMSASGSGNSIAETRFVPSSGSHTYSVRAYRTGGTTSSIQCGTGGLGNQMPAFMSIVRETA